MIVIKDIQDKIIAIKRNLLIEPNTLKEKIIYLYCKKSLNDISNILGQELEIETLTKLLEQQLTLNWLLIKGTLLSYTALPDRDITALFCDMALFVAHYKNQFLGANDAPVGIIELLMPTVAVESRHHDHPDLKTFWNRENSQWQYVDIKKIIKTHVLGNQGQYLIPIKVLTELDPSCPEKLYGPYYDYTDPRRQIPYLHSEERHRLREHSILTRAVFACLDAYDNHAKHDQHLLGHLNVLLNHLRLNSVYDISIADDGTYSAISNFMKLYKRLSPEEIVVIPEQIKKEIGLLEAHTVRGKKTLEEMNPTERDSWLIKHEKNLSLLVRKHESILKSIVLSKYIKVSLLEEKRQEFEVSIKNITFFIENPQNLNAYDKLGINTKLLETLGVDFKIESIQDLDLVTADEIRILLDSKDKIKTIIGLFDNISHFARFIIWKKLLKGDLNEDKDGRGNYKSLHFLCHFLSGLDNNNCDLFLQAISSSLTKIIRTRSDIFSLQDSLYYHNRTHLLQQSDLRRVCQGIIMQSPKDIAQAIERDPFNILLLDWLDPPQQVRVAINFQRYFLRKMFECLVPLPAEEIPEAPTASKILISSPQGPTYFLSENTKSPYNKDGATTVTVATDPTSSPRLTHEITREERGLPFNPLAFFHFPTNEAVNGILPDCPSAEKEKKEPGKRKRDEETNNMSIRRMRRMV